jgi:hypothetical protein
MVIMYLTCQIQVHSRVSAIPYPIAISRGIGSYPVSYQSMDSSSYQRDSSGIAIQMLSSALIAPDSTPSIRYSYPIAIFRGSVLLLSLTQERCYLSHVESTFGFAGLACRSSLATHIELAEQQQVAEQAMSETGPLEVLIFMPAPCR